MDIFMSVSVMFSGNIFIEGRYESILFVYANNILIRIIKILRKSSSSTKSTKFYKTLSCKNFSTKYQVFIFHVAVPFNKYNFYSVKVLLPRINPVITFTFLKEYYSMQRNVTVSNSL